MEDVQDYFKYQTNTNESRNENENNIIELDNNSLENDLKNLIIEQSKLIEEECNRVFQIFSDLTLNKPNYFKLKNVLIAIFGYKMAEKKINLFLEMSSDKKLKELQSEITEAEAPEKKYEKKRNLNYRRDRVKTESDLKYFMSNNLEINYNYNVLYNFEPMLQNTNRNSTFCNWIK